VSKDSTPAFTIIEEGSEPYTFLSDIVERHHPYLSEARIALMWAHRFKADKDGHLTWGTTQKVSSREQQFHAHDFIICLNATVWQELTPEHKRALLDHELCHCGAATDDEGEVTYRVVKHDLEAFVAEVNRHGMWRPAIQALVEAAVASRAKQPAAAVSGG
jgi:hypothetical protein